MSKLMDHLKLYRKYRRAGDQANQDAGKHIPISRQRREGAQRKDARNYRAALIEYCYCVALDFFPDKAVWGGYDTPIFDFDLHEVGKRWYAAADLGGDAAYRQTSKSLCSIPWSTSEHQPCQEGCLSSLEGSIERIPGVEGLCVLASTSLLLHMVIYSQSGSASS